MYVCGSLYTFRERPKIKIMKNNITESVIIQNMVEPKDYYELYTMFLVNNIPLEVVILRDSETLDDGDYSVKGVLSAGSRIYPRTNRSRERAGDG